MQIAKRLVAVGTALVLGLVSAGAGERLPLGPIGGQAEVTAGSAAAVVVGVDAGGPGAKGGLLVGDRIVAVGGTAFSMHTAAVDDGGRGPEKSLGEAVDAAGTGPLVLTVERGVERLELSIELPVRPPFTAGFPAACPAARALREAAAAQLVAAQHPSGMWDAPVGLTGDRVLSAWVVLSLLAHGDPAHAAAIEQGVRWLRGPEGKAWVPDDPLTKGPDNLGNWALTITAVALAEHHLATDDAEDVPVIARCAAALVARMTPEGLFGHDIEPGYGGLGFNVINTQSHFAWAMAAAAGVELNEAAWTASFDQIRRSLDPDGGVRYWTMEGTGTGDASLRTGSMALGLSILEREPELARRFASYLADHAARAREAHAVGSMGMMVSAPALWALDRDGWRAFMEEWRWYLALLRGPDDRVHYIGGKGNNGGDSYLGFDHVACVIALQLLCCPDERLRLHRAPRGKVAGPKAP